MSILQRFNVEHHSTGIRSVPGFELITSSRLSYESPRLLNNNNNGLNVNANHFMIFLIFYVDLNKSLFDELVKKFMTSKHLAATFNLGNT